MDGNRMAESFGARLRRLRKDAGLSQAELARLVLFDQSRISRAETGSWLPSTAFAEACDTALEAGGELVALAPQVPASLRPGDPWLAIDLVRRLRHSEVDSATLDALREVTDRLCTEYRWRRPDELRAEAQEWLRYISRLLDRRVGLRAHRELLVTGGWLALLIGCAEYDMGRSAAAEGARSAAFHLGREAGHAELVAWSFEMRAWFALTQGALREAADLARAGQQVAGSASVAAQLAAHEARALARTGDPCGVRDAFDRGDAVLRALPVAANPGNHFTVSPDRYEYFVMDGYRVLGENERAAEYAAEVLRKSAGRAPMREAQARLALSTVATRAGELEEAVHHGTTAFQADRKCLPSLLLVAGELDRELRARFRDEAQAREFHEQLRSVRRSLPRN